MIECRRLMDFIHHEFPASNILPYTKDVLMTAWIVERVRCYLFKESRVRGFLYLAYEALYKARKRMPMISATGLRMARFAMLGCFFAFASHRFRITVGVEFLPGLMTLRTSFGLMQLVFHVFAGRFHVL